LIEHDDVITPLLRGASLLGLALGPAPARAGPGHTNVLLTSLTSVTGLGRLLVGLHTTTTLADKLLSPSSNVEMYYTTKTKVHATFAFQQFGQRI